MKTVKEVRDAFWNANPERAHGRRSRKRQNDYCADTRCSFVNYVDALSKSGIISEKLAQRVTL